jgi:hypothetical protein
MRERMSQVVIENPVVNRTAPDREHSLFVGGAEALEKVRYLDGVVGGSNLPATHRTASLAAPGSAV